MLNGVYIVDAIRSPIGKYGGSLATVRIDDLAALTLRTILSRNPSLDPQSIDDVILGCANQAGEDNRNLARIALLLAGVPQTVPGMTVNRLCASGMSAAICAATALAAGEGDIYLAGGAEQMTRAPYVMAKPATPFSRTPEVYDTTLGWRFVNPRIESSFGVDSMGQTAENVAQKFNISREDQDLFALRSQHKAEAAQKNSRFVQEIVPVEIPQKKSAAVVFSADEFPRHGSTLEALARLQPAFRKDGSVTAGNSSGINDGACCLLLASEQGLKRGGLKPRAQVRGSAVVGVEPRLMGIGPVDAVKKLLGQHDVKLEDVAVIELNEAFAAQSLACLRQLGLDDDDARVNPNGGAIALGHPLGMSGARLLTTAVCELEQRKAKYAICTMCVGVGQGIACLIERV
jgi:3-oxo-5,6-didehydrosuberyl-CoA/3-oxoadipyl-CoA thiolase